MSYQANWELVITWVIMFRPEFIRSFFHYYLSNSKTTKIINIKIVSICSSNEISSIWSHIQYRSKVSWQSVASLDSRLDSRFLRESSIENREPFIENREPAIENRELLIENRVEDRVWKQRFSHDWFLDNFTLSAQNEPQAATPVLRERVYASEREKSKLIGEKCVLKYFL